MRDKDISYLIETEYDGSSRPRLYRQHFLNRRGELAEQLVLRWGMVTAEDHGKEDSAGRAKLFPQSPQETVQRACDISEAFFAEMEKREWQEGIPAPEVKLERSARQRLKELEDAVE